LSTAFGSYEEFVMELQVQQPESRQSPRSWLTFAVVSGILLGTIGAAVCGYSGIAVTEYQASPRDQAILLALGWGLPYGLLLGILGGVILKGIQRWRWGKSAQSQSRATE
jgi:hypothetical protein